MKGEIERSWEKWEVEWDGGVNEGAGGADRGSGENRRERGSGRRGWLCVSRGPPCELCSREPGHWGEVVRACLKQYTQGFSQSSHTQCARSMSLSQHSPAMYQSIHKNTEKFTCIIAHMHAPEKHVCTCKTYRMFNKVMRLLRGTGCESAQPGKH